MNITAPDFLLSPNLPKRFFFLGILTLSIMPLLATIKNWSLHPGDLMIFILCLLLFLWSYNSPLISQQPVNKKHAYILLGIAIGILFIDHFLASSLLDQYALITGVVSLGVITNLCQRSQPISPFWLALLSSFSLAGKPLLSFSHSFLYLPENQHGMFSLLAILFCLLMTIARPRPWQSAIALIFLVGISLSLIIFQDIPAYVYLFPIIVFMLLLTKWVYQKPIRPHRFIDTIRWTVPPSLKTDGWWLDLLAKRRQRLRISVVSFVFLICCIGVVLFTGQFKNKASPLFLDKPDFQVHQEAHL